MRNAVIWYIEARCVVDKIKPPEETGLTLSHCTIAVFTNLKIFVNAREEMRQKS